MPDEFSIEEPAMDAVFAKGIPDVAIALPAHPLTPPTTAPQNIPAHVSLELKSHSFILYESFAKAPPKYAPANAPIITAPATIDSPLGSLYFSGLFKQ